MSQIYRKENGKFVKVGPYDGWNGFPSDGIWVVQMGNGVHSSTCISRLQDLPKAASIATFHLRRDSITKAITNYFNKKSEEWDKNKNFSYCAGDIANVIIKELARESEEEYKRELLIERVRDKEVIFK